MASFNELLRKASSSKVLDDQIFADLRKEILNDGHVSITEADMIFEIDTNIAVKPEGWNNFFVSVITDFLIRQTLPVGFVDPIHATWLMERIDQDHNLSQETEEALLLNVLRLAEDTPENLEKYALGKIRDKIISRASAGNLNVTADDVALLRRVLYASGGQGGFRISKSEARFLFDLDEISQNQDNDPAWQKLFVGAIANHVMTCGGPPPPDREEYRKAQEYLHSKKTVRWNIIDSFKAWTSQEQQESFTDAGKIASSEVIDMAEAKWLIDHLNRDGQTSQNEVALLRFIKAECPQIHELLDPYLKRVA